jgi:GNAT superfamily N-acetyltransferase
VVLEARLGTPGVWCLAAEDGTAVAGYVSLLPADQGTRPVADPGLMHFWMLFVRPPWWGSGLASRLHAAACAEAKARGFTALRLFTPAAQARARGFYAREGWTVAGARFAHDTMGIDMVEYRRPLA